MEQQSEILEGMITNEFIFTEKALKDYCVASDKNVYRMPVIKAHGQRKGVYRLKPLNNNGHECYVFFVNGKRRVIAATVIFNRMLKQNPKPKPLLLVAE